MTQKKKRALDERRFDPPEHEDYVRCCISLDLGLGSQFSNDLGIFSYEVRDSDDLGFQLIWGSFRLVFFAYISSSLYIIFAYTIAFRLTKHGTRLFVQPAFFIRRVRHNFPSSSRS
ncbi:hypothetical protein IGI04_034397 [Brassica rapa subsp. trilocularis]|uniref:Uncharacterized protein n=1 Tax=Brassica rapa subsp. trilocularis TaxID=1813537 RepID=A0ABQ7L8M4_BRACM|nr:hypothetical protein IGI04_034397 [Brassica rapa subsp. trilocularis]